MNPENTKPLPVNQLIGNAICWLCDIPFMLGRVMVWLLKAAGWLVLLGIGVVVICAVIGALAGLSASAIIIGALVISSQQKD